MKVTAVSRDRLEFRHDGIRTMRPAIWILAGIVGFAAVLAVLAGMLVPLLIVLVLAAFFFNIMRRSSADTLAVFDRQGRMVTLTHSRDGTEIERQEIPLREVAKVIVEEGSGTKGTVSRRPALLVGTRIVPLTYNVFVPGDASMEAALAIRRFLGQSEFRLMEDSKEALERYSERSIGRAFGRARYGASRR